MMPSACGYFNIVKLLVNNGADIMLVVGGHNRIFQFFLNIEYKDKLQEQIV